MNKINEVVAILDGMKISNENTSNENDVCIIIQNDSVLDKTHFPKADAMNMIKNIIEEKTGTKLKMCQQSHSSVITSIR
jgi:hypothetical protein